MEGDNKIEDMEAVQEEAAKLDVELDQPIIFPWEIASGKVEINGVNNDTKEIEKGRNDAVNDGEGEPLDDQCSLISVVSTNKKFDSSEFSYSSIGRCIPKRKRSVEESDDSEDGKHGARDEIVMTNRVNNTRVRKEAIYEVTKSADEIEALRRKCGNL